MPDCGATAYSYVSIGGFHVRVYANRVELERWCLVDGEPGELGERVVVPRAAWDAIAAHVPPRAASPIERQAIEKPSGHRGLFC